MFQKVRQWACKRLTWKTAVVAAAVLALVLAVWDYGKKPEQPTPGMKAGQTVTSPEPGEPKEKVILYFGDKEAMYLIPEEREVVKGNKSLEAAVIQELIKGPQNPDLTRTIPKEAKLVSVKVANGVACANFSREFQTKHWGGSAGEMMTLYSITNSLARLPGIERVQFLIEGEKQESILGHADTREPIAPNWGLIKK